MSQKSFRHSDANRKRGAFLLILKIIKPIRRIVGKWLHTREIGKIRESFNFHIYRLDENGRLLYEYKMSPIQKDCMITHAEAEFFLNANTKGDSKIYYFNGIRENSKVPWLDKHKKK